MTLTCKTAVDGGRDAMQKNERGKKERKEGQVKEGERYRE